MAGRINRDFKKDIRRLLGGKEQGLTADAMAAFLHVKKHERSAFLLTLAQMHKDGAVLKKASGHKKTRGIKGRYVLPAEKTAEAEILSLSRGFGFARLTDGSDCFIAGRYLGDALPGDRVLLALEKGDERGISGRILQPLEKGGRLYSGKVTDTGDAVQPDAFFRFPIDLRGNEGVSPGEKIRFSVGFDRYGELTAKAMTIYGNADSAKVCADAIIDNAGIPSGFPDEVLEEAGKKASADISADDLKHREDLRGQIIFTIDGHDAKDLDDAVSIEETCDGYLLGVHIADVSHYVRDHTLLNDEALSRGTSVYFADRVIPMLPEALSNGACSLNAGEDKLALSALITFDLQGHMKGFRFCKSVIRSCLRGIYAEVNTLFDGTAGDELLQKYAAARPSLTVMRALAEKLRHAAAARGTMDLEGTESAFVLDEDGHPVTIVPRRTGESEGLIEQFMIAANVACAAYARQKKLPFIYRIHENPDSEKLGALEELAGRLSLGSARLTSQAALRGLMEAARETQYARLISDRILRSMAKAKYSEKPVGHYGLALSDYCHFTSPIRRYPDLAVHRILSASLGGMRHQEIINRYEAFVHMAAEQSSRCELRAMTAERECEDCYKAEYMGRFIGEEFDGVIASATAFGLFVELPNSVQGLIRMENLPEENLRWDDAASLTDMRGKPVYSVGDAMRIRVDATDVSSGRIDFSPAESAEVKSGKDH